MNILDDAIQTFVFIPIRAFLVGAVSRLHTYRQIYVSCRRHCTDDVRLVYTWQQVISELQLLKIRNVIEKKIKLIKHTRLLTNVSARRNQQHWLRYRWDQPRYVFKMFTVHLRPLIRLPLIGSVDQFIVKNYVFKI